MTVAKKATQTLEQRIEAARKKAAQFKAQAQALEARQKTLAIKTKRQDDVRRKILLGSMTLEAMEADEKFQQETLARLARYLTRPQDRALFEFDEHPSA